MTAMTAMKFQSRHVEQLISLTLRLVFVAINSVSLGGLGVMAVRYSYFAW
jgi:hypothetical protein